MEESQIPWGRMVLLVLQPILEKKIIKQIYISYK